MHNPMSLDGKHILITGASSGIGRHCAIIVSRLGAKVTLLARRADKLCETISLMDSRQRHNMVVFDLENIDCISDLISEIALKHGPLDGFCHAAGLATVRPLKLSNNQFLDKIFRVNIYSFIELTRCLCLKKHLNNDASIVGISSVAAEHGEVAQCAYAASKAAMNGFLQPAAKELAQRGIRINTVSFAMVDTPMYQEFLNLGGNPSLVEKQCLGIIDVESAANAIAFLLSDACKYITGSVLPVHAGY